MPPTPSLSALAGTWRALRGSGGREARAVGGATLYAVAVAADNALQLVVLPFITRAMSVSEFAQYALLTVLAPLLVVLVDFGCGVAVVRELATQSEPEPRGRTVSTVFWSRTALALAVLGAVSAAVPWGERLVGDGSRSAVQLWGLAVALWAILDGSLDALRGQERHRVVALGLIARGVSRTAAILALVVYGGQGLAGCVAAIAISCAVPLPLALVALGRDLLRRPSLTIYRRLLGFGAPAAAYYGLRVASGLDRFLVRALGGLAEVGLYHLASTAARVIELLEHAMALALEPYVFGSSREAKDARMPWLLRGTSVALMAAATGVTLIGPELLGLLGPQDYAPALEVIPFLVFAAVARAQLRFVALGAHGEGPTRVWALAGAAELLCAAGLVSLATPRWGAVGAAGMRLVGVLLALGLAYRLARAWGSAALPVRAVAAASVLLTVFCGAQATALFGLALPFAARLPAAFLLSGATAYLLLYLPLSARRLAAPAAR